MRDYTVVVTSCGRFDLLTETLNSLLPRLNGSLEGVLIIEDSGNSEVIDVVREISPEIEVIVNEKNLGQLASIDRAYSKVKTKYVFHCEDDWEFFDSEFVYPSIDLLEAIPEISMVSLRARTELNKHLRNLPTLTLNSLEYFVADPSKHPEYFSYSFNPGMRRLSDYRRFAPLKDLRGERTVSYCFKKLGYKMAYLERPCVRHIGDNRHVDDEHDVKRPRSAKTRFSRSIYLRSVRLHRLLFPNLDPAVQIKNQTGEIGTTRLASRAA